MPIFDRGGSGNAVKIQSVDVSATPPTVGQVLKADAAGEWAPGVDSDSANAVTLQGRPLAATAPTDGYAIKWNAGAPAGAGPGEWQPHPDSNSTDATAIRSVNVDPTAPAQDQGLFLNGAGEYVPGDVSAKQIQGVDITGAPLGDGKQLVSVVGGGTSTWDLQDSAGVLTDGTRSYLRDSTENLGLGIASGLAGKLHAKEDGATISCKLVTESDNGPAAVHVRADSLGTQGDAGYGNFQIWNGGNPKVNLHYNPAGDELIINSDGSSNATKGLCIKSDGTGGRNLGDLELGSNSFGQVADIANAMGNDGNPLQTNINTAGAPTPPVLTITSGNGNLTRVLAPGDLVALSSAPTVYVHIISVDSDTQATLAGALGDGSATQQIKVQKSILDARMDGGTVAMVLDAKAQLAVGAGRMDPEGSLHVSDTTEALAIVDSFTKQAQVTIRSNNTGPDVPADPLDIPDYVGRLEFHSGDSKVMTGRIWSTKDATVGQYGALSISTDPTMRPAPYEEIPDDGDSRFTLMSDGRMSARPGSNNGDVGGFDINGQEVKNTLRNQETGAALETLANNTTTLTLTTADYLNAHLATGDLIRLSSDLAEWATVTALLGGNNVGLSAPLGDGTTQTIDVDRSVFRVIPERTAHGYPALQVNADGDTSLVGNLDVRQYIASSGNATITITSPDDQAVVSIRADSSGSASGTNRDPSINFHSGAGGGAEGRIRYYADSKALAAALKDSPSEQDFFSLQLSDRGTRTGVRQNEFISGLSAKGLEGGTKLQDTNSPGVDYIVTPLSIGTSFTITAPGSTEFLEKVLACGDRVAVSSTVPVSDDEYVEVLTCSTFSFTTAANTGTTTGPANIYIKPAQFRLEKSGLTQESSLVVDSEGRGRFGVPEVGLDATLNINGTMALNDAGAQTAPAGSDLASIYYRSPALGNDEFCKLLLHFDADVPHGGAWADSAWGSTFEHIVTSNGVTIDNTIKKFGDGSAKFDGFSTLKIDDMLGSRGEFFPTSSGFTLTSWLYLPTSPASNTQPLWGTYGTASNWQNIVYDQGTNTLSCNENTGAGKTLNWAVPLMGMTHSTWHYLMIAYEGGASNKVFVFVDGTLINSGGTPMLGTWNNLFSTAAINVGYDQGDSNQMFEGWMDELSWSATSRQSASFVSPTEPFYAEGLYVYHAGRSAPFRLKPTGS